MLNREGPSSGPSRDNESSDGPSFQALPATRRRQSHLCFCGRMSPGFAQISIRPRLLAAAARHGEIDQGEREGKRVEGKICNDKGMRQCLFPWNFNQFFSLVLFTSIYLQLQWINLTWNLLSCTVWSCPESLLCPAMPSQWLHHW